MLTLPRLPELTSDRIALIRKDFERLTPREKQVAQAVVEGLTSKEFARRNNISARTVELYRTRIFEKLGVRNASDLVRAIAALGMPPIATEPPPARLDEIGFVAATTGTLRLPQGGAAMADILTGIAYRRQPEREAINVFMMWDSAGEASGYLLVPETLERELLAQGLPQPGEARPLTNAISYGLLLALKAGLPLQLTGDRQVWNSDWGILPA